MEFIPIAAIAVIFLFTRIVFVLFLQDAEFHRKTGKHN